jgi:hypothetical protein
VTEGTHACECINQYLDIPAASPLVETNLYPYLLANPIILSNAIVVINESDGGDAVWKVFEDSTAAIEDNIGLRIQIFKRGSRTADENSTRDHG